MQFELAEYLYLTKEENDTIRKAMELCDKLYQHARDPEFKHVYKEAAETLFLICEKVYNDAENNKKV